MKPAETKGFPYRSLFRSGNHEAIARNIVTILSRTGNEWRELTEVEYIRERIADAEHDQGGGFNPEELIYFRAVAPYLTSEEKAREFSPAWANLETTGR